VSQYPSPIGAWTDNQNMYARVNGCMNELKDVHEVRTTEVCEVSLTKNLRGKPTKIRLGKVQENLEKDSPWLLVFLWDERLHLVGSQVVMELVQCMSALYGSQLSLESSNPDQRTRIVKVDRRLRSQRCPRIDSTMNSCSLCCATVSGLVRIGL
jgi:hypothetical protein